MKAKTKNAIKRTVAVSLIALTLASGLTCCYGGTQVSAIDEKMGLIEDGFYEAKGAQKACLDVFKKSDYYKNYIITEQSNLSKKFENAQISSEEYSNKLSTLVSNEQVEKILLESTEEDIKNYYLNLQEVKQAKVDEYEELSDKQNNMAILALAGLAGTVGFGIGAVAFPTKKDDEKKNNDYEEDYL